MVTAHRGHGARGLTAAIVPAILAAILASPAPAFAAPAPYAVSFAGPDGCPREADVRADVAVHVQDAARTAGARVELRVIGAGGRFTGELVATDAAGNRGRRAVDGASCEEVAHALAFLAGMALELGGRLEAPAAAPPPAAVLRATTGAPERTGPAYAGVAALGVRGGIAPGLRPAGEIGIELGVPRAGGWSPAGRATAMMGQGRAGATVDLLLTALRLQLCPVRVGRGAFEARPCAAGELGAVWARPDSTGGGGTDTSWWAAGEASLQARWWLTAELFVDVAGGALFPAVRTGYAGTSGETIYRVPAVAGRVVLAAGLRL